MESEWRKICGPIIRGIISDIGLHDTKALRKALHEAYPFGERKYHPYKIWLDEIRRAKGLKPPLHARGKDLVYKCPNTPDLFGDLK